jgi:chromosome segregation ATPase
MQEEGMNAVTEVMDELRKALAELEDCRARNADLRTMLERVTRERDEARAEAAKWKAGFEEFRSRNTDLMMQLFEAQEKVRAVNIEPMLHLNAQLRSKVHGLSAEVGRLTDERDELLVRVANQDAELRATREAYNEARAELTRERIGIRPVDEVRSDAYRRGAEAMRDECIGAACGFFMGTTGFCNGDEDELEAVLEALPIPEEP